jgi:hypothetical protein
MIVYTFENGERIPAVHRDPFSEGKGTKLLTTHLDSPTNIQNKQ